MTEPIWLMFEIFMDVQKQFDRSIDKILKIKFVKYLYTRSEFCVLYLYTIYVYLGDTKITELSSYSQIIILQNYKNGTKL